MKHKRFDPEMLDFKTMRFKKNSSAPEKSSAPKKRCDIFGIAEGHNEFIAAALRKMYNEGKNET